MLRQAIYRMSVISVDKLEHPAVALVVTGADVILDRILELVAVCIRVHHLGDRGGCRVVRDLVVVVGAWIIGAFVEWHLCTTRGLRAAHIDEAVVLPDPGLRKSNTDQADQNHEHKQVCQRLGSQGRRHYKQVRTESKGCNARRRCWRLDFQEMRCELFQCSRLLAWPSFSQPTNRFASLNQLLRFSQPPHPRSLALCHCGVASLGVQLSLSASPSPNGFRRVESCSSAGSADRNACSRCSSCAFAQSCGWPSWFAVRRWSHTPPTILLASGGWCCPRHWIFIELPSHFSDRSHVLIRRCTAHIVIVGHAVQLEPPRERSAQVYVACLTCDRTPWCASIDG
jgi:hypothetical protein